MTISTFRQSWRHVRLFTLERQTSAVDCDTVPVSFARDWSALQESVSRLGVISPLLVRRLNDGWQLVCGKGRWSMSAQAGVPAIEIECDDRMALELHIQDNLSRGFNCVEIATILHRLHHNFLVPLDELRAYAPLLGLPDGTRSLLDHMSLLRLPSPVLPKVAAGQVPLRSALVLLDFSSVEVELLVTVSEKMRWSGATQREAFALIWEITRRDKLTTSELFASPPFSELWSANASEESGPNKRAGELFWQHLKRRRNPRHAAAEAAFAETIAAVHCPACLSVSAPPFFEKSQLHIEFDCRDKHTFDKAVACLGSMSKEGQVEKLLQIGKPE